MKICYFYSVKNYEYLRSELIKADEQGEYHLPSFATWIEPLETQEFEVSVYDEAEKLWHIENDYRQKFTDTGIEYGGKPYYEDNKYWWATPTYMITIGNIPQGTSFFKINKPEIVIQCAELITERTQGKAYLDSTDKNWIELQAYKSGYRKYLTDEEVAELEAIETERDRIATLINSHKSTIAEYKTQIVEQYGEEALNHILD